MTTRLGAAIIGGVVRDSCPRHGVLLLGLETFRAHWIEVQCCRGTQQLPVRLVLAADPRGGGRTLADFPIRLRCQACRATPASAGGATPPHRQRPSIAVPGCLAAASGCGAEGRPRRTRHGPARGTGRGLADHGRTHENRCAPGAPSQGRGDEHCRCGDAQSDGPRRDTTTRAERHVAGARRLHVERTRRCSDASALSKAG